MWYRLQHVQYVSAYSVHVDVIACNLIDISSDSKTFLLERMTFRDLISNCIYLCWPHVWSPFWNKEFQKLKLEHQVWAVIIIHSANRVVCCQLLINIVINIMVYQLIRQ